jgi:hypothetical protein
MVDNYSSILDAEVELSVKIPETTYGIDYQPDHILNKLFNQTLTPKPKPLTRRQYMNTIARLQLLEWWGIR